MRGRRVRWDRFVGTGSFGPALRLERGAGGLGDGVGGGFCWSGLDDEGVLDLGRLDRSGERSPSRILIERDLERDREGRVRRS
jgi:hypothetical protein